MIFLSAMKNKCTLSLVMKLSKLTWLDLSTLKMRKIKKRNKNSNKNLKEDKKSLEDG